MIVSTGNRTSTIGTARDGDSSETGIESRYFTTDRCALLDYARVLSHAEKQQSVVAILREGECTTQQQA